MIPRTILEGCCSLQAIFSIFSLMNILAKLDILPIQDVPSNFTLLQRRVMLKFLKLQKDGSLWGNFA